MSEYVVALFTNKSSAHTEVSLKVVCLFVLTLSIDQHLNNLSQSEFYVCVAHSRFFIYGYITTLESPDLRLCPWNSVFVLMCVCSQGLRRKVYTGRAICELRLLPFECRIHMFCSCIVLKKYLNTYWFCKWKYCTRGHMCFTVFLNFPFF